MRGSYLDREAVEAKIDSVRSLGFDELRALGARPCGPSPPSDAVSVTCFRELENRHFRLLAQSSVTQVSR